MLWWCFLASHLLMLRWLFESLIFWVAALFPPFDSSHSSPSLRLPRGSWQRGNPSGVFCCVLQVSEKELKRCLTSLLRHEDFSVPWDLPGSAKATAFASGAAGRSRAARHEDVEDLGIANSTVAEMLRKLQVKLRGEKKGNKEPSARFLEEGWNPTPARFIVNLRGFYSMAILHVAEETWKSRTAGTFLQLRKFSSPREAGLGESWFQRFRRDARDSTATWTCQVMRFYFEKPVLFYRMA